MDGYVVEHPGSVPVIASESYAEGRASPVCHMKNWREFEFVEYWLHLVVELSYCGSCFIYKLFMVPWWSVQP